MLPTPSIHTCQMSSSSVTGSMPAVYCRPTGLASDFTCQNLSKTCSSHKFYQTCQKLSDLLNSFHRPVELLDTIAPSVALVSFLLLKKEEKNVFYQLLLVYQTNSRPVCYMDSSSFCLFGPSYIPLLDSLGVGDWFYWSGKVKSVIMTPIWPINYRSISIGILPETEKQDPSPPGGSGWVGKRCVYVHKT